MLKMGKERNLFFKDKHSQLAIFVIIAIIIVAGIVLFFTLREKKGLESIPARFRPIEQQLLDCMELEAESGISIIGEQGGYIYLPKFEPGSDYMPTSSQLSFIGTPVPYWSYISGNNINKEQVPTKTEMEGQLERYIKENLECDFSDFRKQGFEINMGDKEVDVNINENSVDVAMRANLEASFGDESVRIQKHEKEVRSKLGKFYDIALNIYNKERQQFFLEEYGVDVLRLYAPVTGVELNCSPKVWLMQDIEEKLREALEANIFMLKTRGDYYEDANEYFITDIESEEAVQFLYFQDWPTKIETRTGEDVLVAKPVGNQAGLSALGFCYTPYHFVYDMIYPVMIQIYDSNELFQFPVSVVIRGNVPREALPGATQSQEEPEICKYKNKEISVYTYDVNLNPVAAEIDFKCLNQICDIGETEISDGYAVLEEDFPQCVNGVVIANAEGYEEGREQISTNNENEANILLDRLYNINTQISLGGRETDNRAIVYFESPDTMETLVWPDQKEIELTEGQYNITAYVYKNSSIHVEGKEMEKCVDIPKPGLAGFLGQTREECYDWKIPGQTISSAMIGGGKSSQYIAETQLKLGDVEIEVSKLPLPKNVEDLQKNYNIVEQKNVYLRFK